jgi:hypothetical protein
MVFIKDNLKTKDEFKKFIEIPIAKNNIQALEKTLLYAKLFNSGIREDKLHQQIFDLIISRSELNKTIDESTLNGTIININNRLFINYERNGFCSQNKSKLHIKQIGRILSFLDKLPFVSMIAFSGGTSHYGILNHDDIDLFIITKPSTVYIVYFLIHFFSFITRSRKELCANYLIDETNLKINHSHDFYTAHQVISLIPYKNPEMLNTFWKENTWVNKFFPNFNFGKALASLQPSNYYVLKRINRLLMSLYKLYYRKKIILSKSDCSFILTENCMKLHINDNRKKITFEFNNVIKEYCMDKRYTECFQKHNI